MALRPHGGMAGTRINLTFRVRQIGDVGFIIQLGCILWQIKITVEHHQVSRVNQLYMVFFNSYVKLQKGNF